VEGAADAIVQHDALARLQDGAEERLAGAVAAGVQAPSRRQRHPRGQKHKDAQHDSAAQAALSQKTRAKRVFRCRITPMRGCA
jgi:hypothetical protein